VGKEEVTFTATRMTLLKLTNYGTVLLNNCRVLIPLGSPEGVDGLLYILKTGTWPQVIEARCRTKNKIDILVEICLMAEWFVADRVVVGDLVAQRLEMYITQNEYTRVQATDDYVVKICGISAMVGMGALKLVMARVVARARIAAIYRGLPIIPTLNLPSEKIYVNAREFGSLVDKIAAGICAEGMLIRDSYVTNPKC
jgi:hypothetical protein